MDNEFLLQEFSQMFEEKRHYDNRLFSFITMLFALLTINVSVVAFVYESSIKDIQYLAIALSLIQIIAGLVVVTSLYHNRVSYVKVCRQINSIRLCSLTSLPSEYGFRNLMYINPEYPQYLKLDSMHLIVIVFVIAINSMCVGVLVFFAILNISQSIVGVFLTFSLQFFGIIHFLQKRDKK